MKKPPGNPAARIERLRDEAAGCRDCPLWENATQTVFGEGDARAKLMLVGEQPGDQEDRAGHPFVGPAGRILDQALAEAGIERERRARRKRMRSSWPTCASPRAICRTSPIADSAARRQMASRALAIMSQTAHRPRRMETRT